MIVPFQALSAYGVCVDAVFPGKKADDFFPTAIHQSFARHTYTRPMVTILH